MAVWLRRLSAGDVVLLGIAILVVMANGVLFGLAQRVAAAQEELVSQETRARGDLQRLRSTLNLDQLRKERETLDKELATSQEAVPARLQSLELANLIIRAAEKRGIQLRTLRTEGPPTEKIGDREYRALRYRVEARALFPEGLSDLMEELEKSPFRALSLSGISLSQKDQGWVLGFQAVALAQR